MILNILAIDPGSTSTKIGVFINGKLHKTTIEHEREIIDSFAHIMDQKDMRFETVDNFLKNNGYDKVKFDAVVGRGGLIKPIESGVYEVNEAMLRDLKNGVNGFHASNLGGILAYEFSRIFLCYAFIVDPVVVDEMDDVARLSGLKDIERKSIFHALNHKSAARKAAEKLGKNYDELNLIVAHMGGGISIGIHKQGRVVDVNNALDGEGPFAMERTGSLPVGDLVRLIDKKRYTTDELLSVFSKKGGVYSYLKNVDMIEIEKRIKNEDKYAKLVIDALVYQVAKEIGALSCAVSGEIDAIVLTGGLAKSNLITNAITKKVKFIADVMIFGGEFELEALVESSLMALKGMEKIKEYK